MCVCMCVCVCIHNYVGRSCASCKIMRIFFFTVGFKTETGVAVESVSTKCSRKPLTCHLPDDSSIIYTADL